MVPGEIPPTQNGPTALYEYGSKGRVEKSWAPLLDEARTRVLLIQESGKIADGKPQVRTFTGMLRPIGDDLRQHLAQNKNQVEDIPVETKYVLVEGERPEDVRAAGVGAFLAFLVLAITLIVTLMRNTVFETSNVT